MKMIRRVKKIIHFFILSCPQATLEIEKKLFGKITIGQWFRLKCHVLICKWCRAYQKKTILMDHYLHKRLTQNNKKPNNRIDTQLLKRSLAEKMKKT